MAGSYSFKMAKSGGTYLWCLYGFNQEWFGFNLSFTHVYSNHHNSQCAYSMIQAGGRGGGGAGDGRSKYLPTVSSWHRTLELGIGHLTRSSKPSEGLPVYRTKELYSFLTYLRPWVLLRPRKSNPRPPARQSSALPTELTLPRLHQQICVFEEI